MTLRDTEETSDIVLAEPAVAHTADLPNFVAGQDGATMALACGGVHPAGSFCVGTISCAGSPFEVSGSVVRLVKVDMVPNLCGKRWATERRQDKSVHESLHLAPAEVEPDCNVSVRGQAWSEHLVIVAKRADAPEAGYLVEAFVPDNRKPSFCGRILLSHRTSLSGLWSELRQAFARPAARFVSGEFYHA